MNREQLIQQRLTAQANLKLWLAHFEQRPDLTAAEMVARYATKLLQMQKLIDAY
jgi:hypothetical protein